MAESKELKLSPSSINGFIACPRCFWLNIHGHRMPGFPPVLHNIMDLIEKGYYDKFRSSGLPPLLKGKLPFKLADQATVESLRHYIGWKDDKTGDILRGKLDDCFIGKDGTLIVMDNKTKAKESAEVTKEYEFQLSTYAFLLSKNGFKVNMETGYLVYFVPDKASDLDKGVKFNVEINKVALNTDNVPVVFRKAALVAKQAKAPPKHKECEVCMWLHRLEELEL